MEFKALRHLFVGEFYPLLPHSVASEGWNAYQFHRPDLGEGLVLLFRNEKSPYVLVDLALHGLDAGATYGATYGVTFVDADGTRRMTGSELMEPMRISIEDPRKSVMVTYSRKANGE